MATFSTPMIVRYQHCDAAGIVFYPRYFEMLHETVERFFEEQIGWSFVALQTGLGITVPTDRIETDFRDPSWLEDRLEYRVQIAHLGRSTLTLQIEVLCGTDVRLASRQTLVCIPVGGQRSVPWPPEIRGALETFQEG
jgi:4-hydroxybenzoyl-CoA thioesterase